MKLHVAGDRGPLALLNVCSSVYLLATPSVLTDFDRRRAV